MNGQDEKILGIFRETGALLEGHFILRSGLHSGHFFQCARVCEHMDRVTELVGMLAQKLGDAGCETVMAPAIGGLVLGQVPRASSKSASSSPKRKTAASPCAGISKYAREKKS